MSIRNSVRRGLVHLDTRLGIREWLRQDDIASEEHASKPSDPFALSELQHPRPNTVLDIGANNGQFAADVFRAFPGVTVYSFEPITECYERLLLMREQQPTLRPIQLALSDRDGEMDFWLSRFRDSSSIQEMMPTHTEAWPHTEIEAKIRVPIARLDSIASELNLKPPVFAKLDVQGHELAVINGGRETLSLCQRVMLECNFAPLYKGQPSFTQLYDELHSLGFFFDGFISALRHPKTLEQLSSDAVFYKPLEGAVPDGEQAK
jgi:FkbM family methyltransferase